MKTSKLRSRAEGLQNFDDVLKNRVPARDVLKISSICRLKGEVLGGSFLGFVLRVLDHQLDRLRKNVYTHSILNCFAQDPCLSIKIALPCVAS